MFKNALPCYSHKHTILTLLGELTDFYNILG